MGLINSCNAPKWQLKRFRQNTKGAWWWQRDAAATLLALHSADGKWAALIYDNENEDEAEGPYLGGMVKWEYEMWRVDSDYFNTMAQATSSYMAAIARLNQ